MQDDNTENKYFVFTGNTNFGVQNLEYDPYTGDIFMAVYRGRKPQYPNLSMYVIDGKCTPREETLVGCGAEKGKVLNLKKSGIFHEESGVYGYEFKFGSTGIIALGDGYFYFSENRENYQTKEYESTIRLYRYTGEIPAPFSPVSE